MLQTRLAIYLTLVVAAIATLWGAEQRGVAIGRKEVQRKWDQAERQRVAAEEIALISRTRNNERVAEQQALEQQRIKQGYEDEIKQIQRSYGGLHADAGAAGLRLPASVCHGPAAPSAAASTARGNGAAAATIALPAEVGRNLQDLMQEADTMVAHCRAAQSFLIDSGFGSRQSGR